jgi:hypothetical protein
MAEKLKDKENPCFCHGQRGPRPTFDVKAICTSGGTGALRRGCSNDARSVRLDR